MPGRPRRPTTKGRVQRRPVSPASFEKRLVKQYGERAVAEAKAKVIASISLSGVNIATVGPLLLLAKTAKTLQEKK